jgi:hypothetical protein
MHPGGEISLYELNFRAILADNNTMILPLSRMIKLEESFQTKPK